jgi:hypothetical protein
MPDVRLQIGNQLMDKFQDALGTDVRATDIAKDALTLYNWAIEQRKLGRVVTSSNLDGTPAFQLSMPSLDKVKQG